LITTIINEVLLDGIERKEFNVENIQDVSRSLRSCILFFSYGQLFLQSAKFNKEEIERMLEKLLDQIAP
jgi:hypothetical protein